MKTQGIKKIAVLTLAVVMLTGVNLYAQKGKGNANQGRNYQSYQECRIPDLTEDQQNKIDALRLEHMKEMNAYRNQMNELRAKKHTLMTSDNADMKEINGVIDQMTSIHNTMMKSSAKHQQSVRSLLTDEQRVYFDSRPMRGHGMGMHDGNGRGRGNGRGDGYNRGYGRGLNPNCPYNDQDRLED